MPEPNVELRQRMAAESLLDNESLREGLDEAAAKPFLDFGIRLAKSIAAGTAGMDDEQAEEFTYPRLKALRKMLGALKDFCRADGFSPRREALDALLEQARVVYGDGFAPPSGWALGWLALLPGGNSVEMIGKIQSLVEKPGEQGENHDEEQTQE